jgi:Matrixin
MMRSLRLGILGLALALPSAASAQIGVWEDGDTNLFVGDLSYWWASQVARAANEWNDETNFTFKIKGNGLGACDRYDSGVLLRGDEHTMTNGVEFNDTMCGMEDFPPGVLAVCQSITADGFIQQAGLVFNNEEWSWAVYTGPLGEDTIDFHRVAVHELGHFLGLDHTDSVSIMQPFVSDEIEDIQPFDIAAVNGMYGPDGTPVGAGGAAPVISPQAACQVKQLKAGAKLCKAELACEAKRAKDPAGDPSGAKRDACVGSAEAAFVAAWDSAVAATAAAGGCHDQEAGAAVAPMVRSASGDAAALVGSPDDANSVDRALRAKLMKKAGALCGESFGAWRKHAVAPSTAKLTNGLARARERFVGVAGSAIANATSQGVSYDGASGDLIADEVETLSNEMGLATGAE